MTSSSRSQVARLIKRDGPLCHYCGCQLHINNWTRDHIWPKSRGGPWELSNLVLACRDCNSKLGNRIWKCTCKICYWANIYYSIH